MSILDQYVAIKKESAYGTVATGAFIPYESDVDGFSRDVEFVEGSGKYRGKGGMLSTRRRIIDRGATGSIDSIVLTAGELTRLEELLGASTGPTMVTGSTTAFATKLTANSIGPVDTYTVNLAREDSGGTMHYFQYAGAIPTGFSLSVDQGGELRLAVNYDCQSEGVISTAPTAPIYPSGAEMYIFEDVGMTLGGTSVTDFKSFSIDVELMLDTERFFLQSSAAKKKPIRSGVPTFEGTLSGEFGSLTQFTNFVAGDTQELVLTATFPTAITGTVFPTFTLTLPAVQYNGTTPESTLDGVSTIELPFSALWHPTNGICVIDVVSTDTTF